MFRRDLLGSEMRRQFVTMEELAAQTGVSLRTISRWHTGVAQPRPRNVRALAAALGCEPQDFYENGASHDPS